MKTKTTSGIILFCLLISFMTVSTAQNSFYEYKESFKPTNMLFSPDNEIVYAVKDLDAQQTALVLQEYILKNDLKSFSLIILSIDRNRAGQILDAMEPGFAIKGMQFLADKWALDLAYYLSEKTFNEISDRIGAIRHYGFLSLK